VTTLLAHALLAAWSLPGPQDISELLGKQAPSFALPRLTEGNISLADLRGRPVVLVFGSTKESAPASLEWMIAIEAKLEDKPTYLYQVAVLDNPWYIPEFAARAMLKDFVPTRGRHLVLIEWGKEVAQAYGIPRDDHVRLVAIDAGGTIRWHYTGKLSDRILATLLQHVAD
jgi:hypothetical protein